MNGNDMIENDESWRQQQEQDEYEMWLADEEAQAEYKQWLKERENGQQTKNGRRTI